MSEPTDFGHLWAWEPIHPREVGSLLDGSGSPWWVCGGWACDLSLGTLTRRHEDLDVAILRRDQRRLREHLESWDLRYAAEDHSLHPWAGQHLDPPIHGIWARRSGDAEAPWTCEFLLNETRDGDWVYRRNDAISRPLGDIGATREGVPFLKPKIVLLFKSGESSPKNDADFRALRPDLSDEASAWLREALEICDPGHPWVARLRGS